MSCIYVCILYGIFCSSYFTNRFTSISLQFPQSRDGILLLQSSHMQIFYQFSLEGRNAEKNSFVFWLEAFITRKYKEVFIHSLYIHTYLILLTSIYSYEGLSPILSVGGLANKCATIVVKKWAWLFGTTANYTFFTIIATYDCMVCKYLNLNPLKC